MTLTLNAGDNASADWSYRSEVGDIIWIVRARLSRSPVILVRWKSL